MMSDRYHRRRVPVTGPVGAAHRVRHIGCDDLGESDLPFDFMPWRRPAQRLFISYRRGDTQWLAGRLSDSLGAYFGDKRVFRDIDGIEGGADFGHVIRHTLNASGALIVLIGKDWLSAVDEHGRSRLHQADDWVAQEIGAALDNGMRVFPVLVEDTPMPRAHELPESLRGLTRFNAISVSDARWEADVARLARIVSLDIPSSTERQLHAINLLISVALFLTLAFSVTVMVWNLLQARPSLVDFLGTRWQFSHLFDAVNARGDCRFPPPASLVLLQVWQATAVFLVLVPAGGLMLMAGRHVQASRKGYLYAAGSVALVGSLVAFVLYLPVCLEYEAIVIFYVGLLVAPLVLGLMSLSGFKAR